MVDQDKLKSCIDSVIAGYKPLGKVVSLNIPQHLFNQFKEMSGFTEKFSCGNKTGFCVFEHAPWLRLWFRPFCEDITVVDAWDAPQPKALRMTNLKAVWK